MFENLKKTSVKRALVSVILLVVIGVVLIGLEFSNVLSLLKGRVQFESLAPDEINDNLIVDANISVNFGAFLEEYEENTKTHVTRTTDMYYVIWTGDEDDTDYRYMGIKVPASDISEMDAMADATYYYEYVEPIQYSGAINKMDSEEWEYFQEYFLESGFTEEELDEWLIPYYISVGALTGGAAVWVWIIFVIGILLVVLGIIKLISALNGGGLKKFKNELASYGIGENEAEYEYENAKEFGKGTDIRVGRKLTFYMVGSKPHAILNDKLVWAYQNTTTHRTNGIKTGTTYSVVLNTYEKKSMHLGVSSENQAVEVLQYIRQTLPWVVVGYSDDLSKLYNKDFQGFLQLLYNNVKNGQM